MACLFPIFLLVNNVYTLKTYGCLENSPNLKEPSKETEIITGSAQINEDAFKNSVHRAKRGTYRNITINGTKGLDIPPIKRKCLYLRLKEMWLKKARKSGRIGVVKNIGNSKEFRRSFRLENMRTNTVERVSRFWQRAKEEGKTPSIGNPPEKYLCVIK
uniref:Uncharacterized protein n=1 Tax=Cacopsylla melanoneura TaxID=428564 RepID=A0A8D8W4A2_9HEMI